MILDSVLQAEQFTPRGIVHIGANKGQEMARYQDLGVQLMVWVEADAEPFDLLTKKVAEAADHPMKQICIKALVTDTDGASLTFHRNSVTDTNSIFEMNEVHRSRWAHIVPKETVTLTSSRLDTVLAQNGVAPGDLDALSIDVQGAELLVLKGAGAYLGAVTYVEVETGKTPYYVGQHEYVDLAAYLKEHGFVPITKVPRYGDIVFRKAG